MRVTIRDKSGKDLLSLIIGKEVPGRPGLRYVRRAGQDPIYTAAVSTANLSTNFDRWIEKNILKMNAWDLDRLWVRDYSTALGMDERGQVGLERENRGEIVLQYNEQGDPHWKLIEDRRVNKDGTLTPVKMADDEELNVAKIDELKNALDDLKIVNVARKPEGISADLKASADFMKKKEAILTLASRGFIVAMTKEGGDVEICSKEGEVRSLMKDGVEYVLRFGEIAEGSDAGSAEQDEKDKDQKEGQEKEVKKPAAGQNRYLFVMAEFNPEAIPKPKMEPLPEAENNPAAESKEVTKPEEKLRGQGRRQGGGKRRPANLPSRMRKQPSPRKIRPTKRLRRPRRAKSLPKKMRKSPPSRPSVSRSRRKTSGSRRSTRVNSPPAKNTPRNSTPDSPIGITSFPTMYIVKSAWGTTTSSRKKTRKTQRPVMPTPTPYLPPIRGLILII